MKFNLNDTIKFRITEDGLKYLDAADAGKPPERRTLFKTDENGWCEGQLWFVMATFGPAMYVGCEPPIETEIEVAVQADVRGGEPAFPCPHYHHDTSAPSGLTKREYFAAMAMSGLLSDSNHLNGAEFEPLKVKHKGIALAAIASADALIAELSKIPAGDCQSGLG